MPLNQPVDLAPVSLPRLVHTLTARWQRALPLLPTDPVCFHRRKRFPTLILKREPNFLIYLFIYLPVFVYIYVHVDRGYQKVA